MGLFDSLQGDEQKNPIDVLLDLLNKENIELKTDLNMTQIKILFQMKWFTALLKQENKDKDPYEILDETITYFLQLMVSYKRQSRSETIKGVSEAREKFLETFRLGGGGGT